MARVRYEQRSTLLAVEDYLTATGWFNITYTDGYQPETVINPPHVTVTFPPSNIKELQLGRGTDRLYKRTILISAYMETEPRAQAIMDDIMDFMDLTCIEIKDPSDNFQGTLICPDSESITGQVFSPAYSDPKLLRWRASVTAPFEAFYPGS